MAHACVSTSASSLRFTAGFVSASPNGSSFDSPKLSLPFEPLRSRETKKLVSNIKHWKNSSPKAVYSEGLSIRDAITCLLLGVFFVMSETRQAEASRIREKYPDRIPVIVEKAEKSDVPVIDKKKSDKAIERCIVKNIVEQAAIRDVQEASVYEDTLCQSFTLRCNTVQSFKSKEYVCETFAWMHYYWFLTN
ncbi:unnamed protein product [Thlaspi arvense]|uniref:Multifunctional fusion protein n=1 Tax=Thlaspi arvense TaxID=13288 RepID=A0AAU9R6N0_THLAR|nr:unnamed protein product [Thlaspi arvense]